MKLLFICDISGLVVYKRHKHIVLCTIYSHENMNKIFKTISFCFIKCNVPYGICIEREIYKHAYHAYHNR